MGQSNTKKKKRAVYIPPAKQKKGNGALIWLTIALAFIAVVIVLGINNSSKNASKPYAFEYSELPRLGQEDAPVKIVEFGDYQCPACKNFSETVKPSLVKDYIDTGKVSLYFANYAFIGEDSETAAIAAESVYRQNPEAFWAYNDALYANQGEENKGWVTPDTLVQIAKDAKIDVDYDKLLSDINAGAGRDKIAEYSKLAEFTLRVGGTPAVLIDGKQVKFNSYNDIKAAIESKLNPPTPKENG
ncbi:DsbA family protein [Paenibacillus pasadenensis]|uniref:DsbA family protein n=1 Tax=Paenibacillus pasadenensis TaxID=217090 RepID=UPI00203DED2F|nr:thioredoxin domain-containing protein [Paenibacillus pasadenensis]MCM3747256.1 DsbA family protein [Paenibacillus pasadenensis]